MWMLNNIDVNIDLTDWIVVRAIAMPISTALSVVGSNPTMDNTCDQQVVLSQGALCVHFMYL